MNEYVEYKEYPALQILMRMMDEADQVSTHKKASELIANFNEALNVILKSDLTLDYKLYFINLLRIDYVEVKSLKLKNEKYISYIRNYFIAKCRHEIHQIILDMRKQKSEEAKLRNIKKANNIHP